MNKIVLKKTFILILAFFFFLSVDVFAETDLRRIYLSRRDEYYQAYNGFLSGRKNYFQQGTIQSREKFRQKSRDFLLARDNLISSYFDLLLSKSSFVDSKHQQQLSGWQGWIIEHRKKVGKAYSLEDLIILSREFDEVYPEIERVIYSFLYNRVVEQQKEIRIEIKQLSQELAVQTTNDDWQIEVNEELNQMENYWQEGETLLERVRVVRSGDMKKKWDKISENLKLAKNSLLKVLNYLDEVISRND